VADPLQISIASVIRSPVLWTSCAVRSTTRAAGSASRRLVTIHRTDQTGDESRSTTMYDMYPDWGPAKHRAPSDAPYQPDGPRGRGSNEALQASLDLRDNGGQRPDDN
jgi:hypothetical protein